MLLRTVPIDSILETAPVSHLKRPPSFAINLVYIYTCNVYIVQETQDIPALQEDLAACWCWEVSQAIEHFWVRFRCPENTQNVGAFWEPFEQALGSQNWPKSCTHICVLYYFVLSCLSVSVQSSSGWRPRLSTSPAAKPSLSEPSCRSSPPRRPSPRLSLEWIPHTLSSAPRRNSTQVI